MPEAVAILLAAGLSRRMGAQNKLLLPYQGVSMVRHMAELCAAATGSDVVVVTGHEADEVAGVLKGVAARTVFNPDYAEGQATSVACGLRHVAQADAILIALGDQPLLTVEDVTALLEAHGAAASGRITIPYRGGDRGNPIVVPWSLRAALLQNPKAPGCRRFTRDNPEKVQRFETEAEGFFADIDTPGAYADLAGQGVS